MAEEKLKLTPGADLPKIQMKEIGTPGVSEIDGQIYEQLRKELTWPESCNTFRKMYQEPLIYAALNLMNNAIGKVNWYVKPKSNKPKAKQKALFIEQCKGDMEHTWKQFIQNTLTYTIFGFSISEKVWRYRSKKSGSKFNDNLVGWRKLAPRSQRTIGSWGFSKYGRSVTSVYQDLTHVKHGVRYSELMNSENYTAKGLRIPREDFLLFSYNSRNGNPEGESPLIACWSSWKTKTVIEEQEAIGICRDMGGVPIIGIPPQFMAEDARPDEQATYQHFQKIVRNLHNNEQAGIVLPLAYDDRGNKLFTMDLMTAPGGKQYDTNAIIKRYEDKILTALFADILKLGQDSHGSFSLAGAKTNITAMNIEARLQEIADVINNDLIPDTFRRNGWDLEDLPTMCYEDIDEEDLDQLSKFIHRAGSINYLMKTRKTVSEIHKRAGFADWEDILNMTDEEFHAEMAKSNGLPPEGTQQDDPEGEGLGKDSAGTPIRPMQSSSDLNPENAS